MSVAPSGLGTTAAIVLAFAISAVVPLLGGAFFYIVTRGGTLFFQPRLTALFMVDIACVVLGLSLSRWACDRFVSRYSSMAICIFFLILSAVGLLARANLSWKLDWDTFQLVVGNVTMALASFLIFCNDTGGLHNKIANATTLSFQVAMSSFIILSPIAIPLTFVLNIIDTWHGMQSIPEKLLFNLTADPFLASIWPITWMIWVDAAWSGHPTPLNFLFG
jgi:hypothetical protein